MACLAAMLPLLRVPARLCVSVAGNSCIGTSALAAGLTPPTHPAGAAFGSPQSLVGDPSGTASAATRTSLRNSSSLNTGSGSGRPGSAVTASAVGGAAAADGGGDGGRPSPTRRTRQSIRTTSRLNAAYAIEMMRAEGAKDMRHIMDALVEPPEPQQVPPSPECQRCLKHYH